MGSLDGFDDRLHEGSDAWVDILSFLSPHLAALRWAGCDNSIPIQGRRGPFEISKNEHHISSELVPRTTSTPAVKYRR